MTRAETADALEQARALALENAELCRLAIEALDEAGAVVALDWDERAALVATVQALRHERDRLWRLGIAKPEEGRA